MGFVAVIVNILKQRELHPVWYLEKTHAALNTVYSPICIDEKTSSEIKINKLITSFLKDELKDLDFQISLMLKFNALFSRKSSFGKIDIRKCE